MKRVKKGGAGEITEDELIKKTADFKAAIEVFDANTYKKAQVDVFEAGLVPKPDVLTGMMKNTGLPIFTSFVEKKIPNTPLFQGDGFQLILNSKAPYPEAYGTEEKQKNWLVCLLFILWQYQRDVFTMQ